MHTESSKGIMLVAPNQRPIKLNSHRPLIRLVVFLKLARLALLIRVEVDGVGGLLTGSASGASLGSGGRDGLAHDKIVVLVKVAVSLLCLGLGLYTSEEIQYDEGVSVCWCPLTAALGLGAALGLEAAFAFLTALTASSDSSSLSMTFFAAAFFCVSVDKGQRTVEGLARETTTYSRRLLRDLGGGVRRRRTIRRARVDVVHVVVTIFEYHRFLLLERRQRQRAEPVWRRRGLTAAAFLGFLGELMTSSSSEAESMEGVGRFLGAALGFAAALTGAATPSSSEVGRATGAFLTAAFLTGAGAGAGSSSSLGRGTEACWKKRKVSSGLDRSYSTRLRPTFLTTGFLTAGAFLTGLAWKSSSESSSSES